MVLISISLTSNIADHLPMCLLAICMSLWRNSYYFKWITCILFVQLYTEKYILYLIHMHFVCLIYVNIFWTQGSYQIYDFKYFLPFYSFSFHLLVRVFWCTKVFWHNMKHFFTNKIRSMLFLKLCNMAQILLILIYASVYFLKKLQIQFTLQVKQTFVYLPH